MSVEEVRVGRGGLTQGHLLPLASPRCVPTSGGKPGRVWPHVTSCALPPRTGLGSAGLASLAESAWGVRVSRGCLVPSQV